MLPVERVLQNSRVCETTYQLHVVIINFVLNPNTEALPKTDIVFSIKWGATYTEAILC